MPPVLSRVLFGVNAVGEIDTIVSLFSGPAQMISPSAVFLNELFP